ncbi:MAG: hypothetical protein K0Q95_1055 [Bacteroidota bacterium]|jgi:hypothetical protein|nr:hypothetical protein [Bacteroidota bacterium]
MFQILKEEIVEEIIKCEDPKSVESYINNEITDLKKKGYINHLIMRFIQKLDMKLITFKQSVSSERMENIRLARQILLNKMLKGVDA